MRLFTIGTLLTAAGLFFPFLVSASAVFAAQPSLSQEERQKIEALILTVENLSDATFIRNDRSYDAASAARFLRGKWRSQESEVRSAEDFIEKVASFSSTTGKPYLIRFRDRREVASAVFLREQLAHGKMKSLPGSP
jgi:hypothetical protein